RSQFNPSAKNRPSAGRVHLAGGLPTPGVVEALEQIQAQVPARSFSEFIGSPFPEHRDITVILPPFIESSRIVEDWESCDYLSERLGEGTRLFNVITVVDADFLFEQMDSAHPLSRYGWGKTAYDARSIADIVVGQVESATHLLVVGQSGNSDSMQRLLAALNPTALRCWLEAASPGELRTFLESPLPPLDGAVSRPSASIVPPWLEMLQGDEGAPCSPGRYLYRRSLPFDPELFREWLADPPCGLIRGKGKVWLAGEKSWAFGYSCAGSVHRVFPVGAWWADQAEGSWPKSESERQRLLQRWHPQFGDRRQELALIGVDLDAAVIGASLDACLVSEEAALESLVEVSSRDDLLNRSALGLEFH
ncbi:GTP-binding protein, partial [Myxococcota bacterium]|nr:GTP-binding protein [Myxococcota bacterium]